VGDECPVAREVEPPAKGKIISMRPQLIFLKIDPQLSSDPGQIGSLSFHAGTVAHFAGILPECVCDL
jgi:hypothetical protein